MVDPLNLGHVVGLQWWRGKISSLERCLLLLGGHEVVSGVAEHFENGGIGSLCGIIVKRDNVLAGNFHGTLG
jgi:hypothetical protein